MAATTERIAIQVTDKVAASVSTKLRKIAEQAEKAFESINRVQSALSGLNTTGLARLQASMDKGTAAVQRQALAQEKLAQAQAKTAIATARAVAAQERAATASAAAQTRAGAAVAAAQNQQSIAQNNLAASAVRLQTAQQRLTNAQTSVNRGNANATKGFMNTSAAARAAGISQKQYENSLRGIPAQISDIVVSLQGGQAPLTVLLQQGAQLKDMFNGVVPALRAVGGALFALLTHPVVMATAAIVALLVMFAKWESAARSLNGMLAQLAATGQNVSIDSSMLTELRKELVDLPDVGRKAADGILQSFISMRNIGGQALQDSISIVGDLGVALGIDTPKAAEKLATALNKPLDGAKDLDKALGFLTVQDFKTINSLEKMGKTAEAQKIILDRLRVAVGGLQQDAMTPLEKSTNGLGKAWNDLMQAMSNSGVMGAVEKALIGIVNALTWVVEKLTALANWKPPSWMENYKPENWIGIGKMFQSGNTGGAEGSWGQPVRGVPAGARRTTESKIEEADLDGKGDKKAEKRATALARINLELDNELKLLNMLGPAREAQEKFDRYQEQFQGKGFKFTGGEEEAIKRKITNLQKEESIQRSMQSIYQEATGPAKEWNDIQEAANRLLERGAITKDQHSTAMTKGMEAYKDSIDPMRQTNKAYQDELNLLNLTPRMREEAAMMIALEAEALAKGLPNREAYLEAMSEEIRLLIRKREITAAYDAIYQATKGAQQELTTQQLATNRAMQEGLLTAEQYQIRMNGLAVAQANLNMTNGLGGFEDLAMASLGRVAEGYQGMLSGLSTSFGDFFTSMSDGFANSIGRAIVYSEDLGSALRSVAQSALSELISALVKVGIQYAINAAIGNSVGASSTAASVAMAATTAAAWAPAAAAVSLATMGANAAPAMTGIALTNALSSAMASIKGFEEGGHTGNGGRKAMAGIVHGQEFVVNARATSKNRELLEAINAGGSVESVSSRSPIKSNGAPVNIYLNVVNNATGTTTSEEQSTDENGDISFKVTVDTIENALAGRMDSGKGRLHKSTGAAFGLTSRPAGG